MPFKFEKLEVWQLGLEYYDLMYELADKLPQEKERFNLSAQIRSAATSINLNIAEGSTGQTDPEQNRFLGLALRSLIETVACQRLAARREYITDKSFIENMDTQAQGLLIKIQAFRNALMGNNRSMREDQAPYNETDI